jgi:hypothetical protein
MIYLAPQNVRFGVLCQGLVLRIQYIWRKFWNCKIAKFPFIPFSQVMVCQLNEMLCKQDGVRPHTANIAILFVGLIEIIIRINVFQDLDVYKYCFI